MKRPSSNKPGCKGDPRMNRAVQARLENPDMPLYQVLRIGGFNFPASEDASTLDNDQVTLGQRKNQLLRRMRQLARKQEKEENEQAQQQFNEQVQQQQQVALTVSAGVFGAGGMYHVPLHQQHQPQLHLQPPPSLTTPLSVHSLQVQLSNAAASMQQYQHSGDDHQGSGTKRQVPPALGMTFGGDQDQQTSGAAKRMVLQHQPLASLRSQTQIQLQQLQLQHPGQLPPTLTSHTMGNKIMSPTKMTTLFQLEMTTNPQPQSIQEEGHNSHAILQHLQQPQSLLGTGRHFHARNPAPSRAAATTSQQHQQPTTTSAAPDSAEDQHAKETLALRVFQQGLQTLYCSSMITAGYTTEDITQRSPYFRRFAFQAWKEECERLQGILGDGEVESLFPHTAAEGGAGTGAPHPQPHDPSSNTG